MLDVSKVCQSWKQYFSHKGWIFDHMFVVSVGSKYAGFFIFCVAQLGKPQNVPE